ncbi:MAG: hypothetical protein C4542_08035 [Dehalococcoidia bacterium]|nr:MAG: hypothetical protein C4542_08035 [Dehalococcoidia bacterium]
MNRKDMLQLCIAAPLAAIGIKAALGQAPPTVPRYEIFCEPACYGDEETGVAVRDGNAIIEIHVLPDRSLHDSVKRIMAIEDRYQPCRVHVERYGIGMAYLDMARDNGRQWYEVDRRGWM